MIEVTKLTKRYGDREAVSGLSFEVAAGEILGLVGPNGAGKTTTLRALCGVIPPSAGRICLAGFDLAQQPVEAKRQLAFVPDEPRLFEHLTARDHILFQARMYGIADGFQRGVALLEGFGLADRLHSFPAELSRGMKQKLMVTLALLHSPRVLVLDEPLTGLDPGAMRKMKEAVRATASGGTAVLISSHLLTLVEELCDRVLLLNHGARVLYGTIGEIRSSIPDLPDGADLEQIFLKATEDSPSS